MSLLVADLSLADISLFEGLLDGHFGGADNHGAERCKPGRISINPTLLRKDWQSLKSCYKR
jgi:hypothetical protein